MYQSNRSFNIHPPGNPPGIWTFEDWLVQIPSPRGKKAVQMPHQLVLKYLSTKPISSSITFYTLFRERYAVMIPLNFFKRRIWKSYSLTKAKFYLVNPSNPVKTEKTHGRTTSRQEINPVQIPHPFNATFKFPPPWRDAQSNARGMPGGGGCWSFELIGALV